MSSSGSFVMSLDFELYWGVRDKRGLDDYRENLEGVWEAIPAILALFGRYDVRATWATVGFLFIKDREQLISKFPVVEPTYTDENLSPYDYIRRVNDLESKVHFAPELIQEIIKTKGQELATHTFSHYYCLEPGQSVQQFRADLAVAIDLAAELGIATKSLVFPRNQSSADYIQAFSSLGGLAYRGNEKSYIYQAAASSGQNLVKRAARLLDAYIDVSGSNTYRADECVERECINVPSSRFLRPYIKKLSFLDGLRLERIKGAMSHAAKHGEIFHLWWHPHNFGKNLTENMKFLEEILLHYKVLAEKEGMKSRTMLDIAELCCHE